MCYVRCEVYVCEYVWCVHDWCVCVRAYVESVCVVSVSCVYRRGTGSTTPGAGEVCGQSHREEVRY